jgi:hypothetical protein
MKRIIFLILIFQFLYITKLFSQTQYDQFMLMWYDHSTQSTPITTMTQNYENLQDHNFNSALVWFRLTHAYYNIHLRQKMDFVRETRICESKSE